MQNTLSRKNDVSLLTCKNGPYVSIARRSSLGAFRRKYCDRVPFLGGDTQSRARAGGRTGTTGLPSFARLRVVAALGLVGSLVGVVASSSTAQASSIGGDKTRVSQLEAQIQHESQVIQALVQKENRVQLRLQVVQTKITAEQAKLVKDRKAQSAAAARLRQVAMNSYVYAASGAASNPLLAGSSAATAAEQQAYSGVASGMLSTAVSSYKTAEYRTQTTEAALHRSKVHLSADLSTLKAAQHEANLAIAHESSTLKGVKGNLAALIEAAQIRRQQRLAAIARERKLAAEAAAARKRAQEQQQQQQQNHGGGGPPSPPPPRPKPAPGSYGDPLRGINGLTPERIDQGVDYSGFGPIFAIGDGTVLSTANGGWPGGTFIAYQLTDGPAAGLVVYAAEDIQPQVSVGEHVTAGTVIGDLYGGPDGMETGWADGSALGETMAAADGQFYGSNSTAFGYNFSQLLQATGAPGGILETSPPTGSLPAGWPSW